MTVTVINGMLIALWVFVRLIPSCLPSTLLTLPLPLAERLTSCLLNRLASNHLSETDPSRKADRSVLGLISRVAGGSDSEIFTLGDLLGSAIRCEVSVIAAVTVASRASLGDLLWQRTSTAALCTWV